MNAHRLAAHYSHSDPIAHAHRLLTEKCWAPVARLLSRAFRAACVAPAPPHRRGPFFNSAQHAERMSSVRTGIRRGLYDEARRMLSADDGATPDAERLNLLGVIAEAQDNWPEAARQYGKAIAADSRYEPAQQNMRRIYELTTFGRSAEPVAMGDERPALSLLLRQHDSKPQFKQRKL